MLDLTEFGKRVQAVREIILNMNQSELAEKINISQVLLSRLERGIGGNINVVFDLVNYLYSHGLTNNFPRPAECKWSDQCLLFF